MENDSTHMFLRGVLSLGRRLRAERPPGAVSLASIGLLGTLHRSGPMPARRLAAAQRLAPQSLTRMLARLEHEGWIVRTRCETDGRQIAIALTERGYQVLADDMQTRRIWLEKAMAESLTANEREALLAAAAAMQKLARHDMASSPPDAESR